MKCYGQVDISLVGTSRWVLEVNLEEVTSCGRECSGGWASSAWGVQTVWLRIVYLSHLSGARNQDQARPGGGNKEFIMWDEMSTSIGGIVLFLASSFMVYSSFSALVFFPFTPGCVVQLWGAGWRSLEYKKPVVDVGSISSAADRKATVYSYIKYLGYLVSDSCLHHSQ